MNEVLVSLSARLVERTGSHNRDIRAEVNNLAALVHAALVAIAKQAEQIRRIESELGRKEEAPNENQK